MGCCQSKKGQADGLSKKHNVRGQYGVKELKQNYKISADTKVLGAGSFGKVFLSESIEDPSFKVAIKVLNKKKLGDDLSGIREEVQILTRLDHPNIVRYYETYDDEKYMYFVMEYCPGGELFDKIASLENQAFGEVEACFIMEKLVRAINHCHAQGVVHRDIKPENIMIGNDNEIKLIDFGLSHRSKQKNTQMQTIVGTPYYMAPEVLEGRYNFKCDLWSLGVLMYVLLSGYLPFQGDSRAEVFSKITEGRYHFNHKEFKMVSQNAKDLIQKLLVVDPKLRYSGDQALKHQWFKEFQQVKVGSEEDRLDPGILHQLKMYKGVSKLKKAAMNVLIKMLDTKEIENLRRAFQEIDRDGTGMISAIELKKCLQSNNHNLEVKEIEQIIKEVDFQGNKQINYTEFLAATIAVKDILTEEKLRAIFKQFDVDGSGKITKDNIITAMQKLEHPITKEELEDIMIKHDKKKDGVLSFEEFKQMFHENL